MQISLIFVQTMPCFGRTFFKVGCSTLFDPWIYPNWDKKGYIHRKTSWTYKYP